MLKLSGKQIGITDFMMPSGFPLNPENRWIRRSNMLPWDKIEFIAGSYSGYDPAIGRPSTAPRMAIGALILKQMLTCSDDELVEHIAENAYLQYFVGLPGYTTEKPFESSLMVDWRKRYNEEFISEINRIMFEPGYESDLLRDQSEERPNEGTLILDTTCAPADIAYPQDIIVVSDAREALEDAINTLHKPDKGSERKPRDYRRTAKKKSKSAGKSKKRTGKKMKAAVQEQLNFIRRDLSIIGNYAPRFDLLSDRQLEKIVTACKVYRQQQQLIDNEKLPKKQQIPVTDRIVNFFQPWVGTIVRGKAAHPVEFGAKVAISVIGGYAFVDEISWSAYHDGKDLIPVIEKYRELHNRYPAKVCVDQAYRTKDNRAFCAEHRIAMTGVPLGSRKPLEGQDRLDAYNDSCIRNQVEGKFGVAKIRYGLGRIRARLQDTAQTVISLAFLAMNIVKRMLARFGYNWHIALRISVSAPF